MPVLRFTTYNEQRKKGDQADRDQENTILQRLQTQVHAQEPEVCSIKAIETMDIIKLAFDMTGAVQRYVDKVRRFYYWVMLLGCRCPKCNSGLSMIAEGTCRCKSCMYEFDPTVEFQRCSECGSVLGLRVRRYYCKGCNTYLRSRFLFEGLVFEREYFKAKMAESRQRKKEQRERVRKMLAESRSDTLPLKAFDLDAVPGLLDALNGLTTDMDVGFEVRGHNDFDLKRYETHIQAHIQDFPMSLMDIPPLSENRRRDVIWRFIAVIFLAHTGIIDIWQDGQDIMVIKHETNRQGRGVFGEFEEGDRVERSLGGIEA